MIGHRGVAGLMSVGEGPLAKRPLYAIARVVRIGGRRRIMINRDLMYGEATCQHRVS